MWSVAHQCNIHCNLFSTLYFYTWISWIYNTILHGPMGILSMHSYEINGYIECILYTCIYEYDLMSLGGCMDLTLNTLMNSYVQVICVMNC